MLCMNNFAHDLARSVAGEDILVILDAENERNNRYCDYRYAHVSTSSLQSIDSKAWPSKARSLIFKTSDTELEHVSEVLSVNKYLRVLDLSECSVNEIPATIFQLKQLRYLDASTLSIATLPPQVGSFNKLQTLDLSETELMELPSFLSNLKGLNYLNLQGCQKLQELNSLDLLHELHFLNLSCCPEVRSFPESIENLTKLRFLNLSQCSKLPTLPNRLLQSFASLCSLVDLNLSGFEFQMLPEFFGNICSLQYLNLSKCSKLEELPQSFGQLAYLKALNLSSCPDLKILGSFECLTSLQILNLSNCHSLQYLPLCLQNIKNLDISGCQDCIVQSCSGSSRSSPSQQLSEQAEQVILSNDIFEIIPEDTAIGHLKGKMKLAFASHLDEEPEVIDKPNETGDIVPLVPGHRFLLSSSRSYSFASSSSAPLPSVSSSDVPKMEHPISPGETTGTQSNEKWQEPQGFINDCAEDRIPSLDTPVHPHEVKGSNGIHVTACDGACQCNLQCDGTYQGVVVIEQPN